MSTCNGDRQRVLQRIRQIERIVGELRGIDLTEQKAKEIEELVTEMVALLGQIPDCSD